MIVLDGTLQANNDLFKKLAYRLYGEKVKVYYE